VTGLAAGAGSAYITGGAGFDFPWTLPLPANPQYEFLARISDASPQSCSYSVQPTSLYMNGSGSSAPIFIVNAAAGCAWSASSTVSWVTFSSEPSGTGIGAVAARVEQYYWSGPARIGTLIIAGQNVSIVQTASACDSVTLLPGSQTLPASGGQVSVDVTVPYPACGWYLTASGGATFPSGNSGVGSATVPVQVGPNPAANERDLSISALSDAWVNAEIKQHGKCTATAVDAGTGLTSHSFPRVGGSGSLRVTANVARCLWSFNTDADWISTRIYNPSGFAPGTFSYTVAPNPGSAGRTATIYVSASTPTPGDPVFTVTQDAGNNRSFVSAHGNDSNNCSVAAPCRTLTQALAVTNWGGEIIVVDSGSYDPFTISQPVTISATGVTASITAASGVAILINTTGNVTLAGLNLYGVGTGYDGVLVEQVGVLRLYRVQAAGFANDGVEDEYATVGVTIEDSRFNDNKNGVELDYYGSPQTAYLRNVSFDHNSSVGVSVGQGTTVVSNSAAHYNGAGIYSYGGPVVIRGVKAVSNKSGILASGFAPAVQFSSCSVALNTLYSYTVDSGGTVSGSSPGSSLVVGPANGSLSAPAPLK